MQNADAADTGSSRRPLFMSFVAVLLAGVAAGWTGGALMFAPTTDAARERNEYQRGRHDGFREARAYSTETDAQTVERILQDQHWISGGFWEFSTPLRVPHGSALVNVHAVGGLDMAGQILIVGGSFDLRDDGMRFRLGSGMRGAALRQ